MENVIRCIFESFSETEFGYTLFLKRQDLGEVAEIRFSQHPNFILKRINDFLPTLKGRVYLAFGMTDIDIFSYNNDFIFEVSMYPGHYAYFLLSKADFMLFVDSLSGFSY